MSVPADKQFAAVSLAEARTVIATEGAAVQALAARLDANFVQACRLILQCNGRVVVVGMGKSGHIGRKIAATLASTGSPAFFLHPAEASHGDLGMVVSNDVVIGISNSGETTELLAILPLIKRFGVKLIAMTGKPESTLARQADACLDVSVEKEACPHNLAPTASTTATLVMGDAVAVAVQQLRGFSAQDFARRHPGGVLGKRLLLYARDLMHRGDELPLVAEDCTIAAMLAEMSAKSLGLVGVVACENRLLGMFTDGDVRRLLENKVDFYTAEARTFMNRTPFTITPDMLAAEVGQAMRDFAQHGPHAINAMFVVDERGTVVGALNTHDLLRAGIL